MLRRTLPSLNPAEQEELSQLVVALASLDRRRRRMAAELIDEVRRGQLVERMLRRRRDIAAHSLNEPLFDPQAVSGQPALSLGEQEDA